MVSKDFNFESGARYHTMVTTICDIIEIATEKEQLPNGGMQIRRPYYLTPETCARLAEIIENHNNAYYAGGWTVDREVVARLKKASNQH